ncbi:unnamed protein product, partial [Iphiclides podalirius]
MVPPAKVARAGPRRVRGFRKPPPGSDSLRSVASLPTPPHRHPAHRAPDLRPSELHPWLAARCRAHLDANDSDRMIY